MNKYRLELIGPFGLFSPNDTRINITSKKGIALLALLATSPNGVRSRSWLQTMLWGSREQSQAQASLRRELSSLGKQLASFNAEEILTRDTQRVSLMLEKVDIDIASLGFDLSLHTLKSPPDFLEGLDLKDCEEFEEWLRNERERVADMMAINIPEPALPLATFSEIMGGNEPVMSALIDNQPPRLPPKPSVTIVPFRMLTKTSHEGENEWLGDAMADEIAMILSEFPQLFIVSSSSARALANQGLDFQEIARQLGVRYIVDGTLSEGKDRLRISANLLDATTGEQIWGQSFNGEMAHLFDLQREIALQIAPQIWTKVDINERSRNLRNHSVMPLDNYVLYWRANALYRSWERGDIAEAISLCDQALVMNPTCAWTAALAGFCHGISYMLGFTDDKEASRRESISHYQTALRYGADNAEILGYAVGTLVTIGGDMAVADRLVTHALEIVPAHQPTLFWGGWVDLVNGNAARARTRFELALRLNPATGVRSQTLCGIGYAALLDANFADAFHFLSLAIKSPPVFFLVPIGLCAAASILGETETAQTCARMLDDIDYTYVLGMIQNTQHRQLLIQVIEQSRLTLAG